MGTKESNSYILKDIDPELWKQFKHKLIDDNLNMKDGLLSLVKAYVDGKVNTK